MWIVRYTDLLGIHHQAQLDTVWMNLIVNTCVMFKMPVYVEWMN
jgi:hypothetical protein